MGCSRALSGAWPGQSRAHRGHAVGPLAGVLAARHERCARTLALECARKPVDTHVNPSTCTWAALPTQIPSGPRARCRVGPTCESAGPRARRGTQAASTPRRTAPLTLNVHTWPSVRPHVHPRTGRDAGFTGTRQTRPTKFVTFPRNKAEKSPC